MPTVKVEIDLTCDRCGESLVGNYSSPDRYTFDVATIRVEPCEKCLDDVTEKAYNRGLEDDV